MKVYLVCEPQTGQPAVICEECGKRPLLGPHYLYLGDSYFGTPAQMCSHVETAKRVEGSREFTLVFPDFEAMRRRELEEWEAKRMKDQDGHER